MDMRASFYKRQSPTHIKAYQFSKLDRFPRAYSPTSDFVGPGSYMVRKPSDCAQYKFADDRKNHPSFKKIHDEAKMRVRMQKQICSRKSKGHSKSPKLYESDNGKNDSLIF